MATLVFISAYLYTKLKQLINIFVWCLDFCPWSKLRSDFGIIQLLIRVITTYIDDLTERCGQMTYSAEANSASLSCY